MSDLALATGILAGLAGSLVGLPVALRRFQLPGELLRSLNHVLTAVVVGIGVYFVEDHRVVFGAGVLAVGFLIPAIRLGWLGPMLHGSTIRDYGFVGYAIGIVAVVGTFFPHRDVIIAALLVVGLADPSAAATGRRFGRHWLVAWGCRRSAEGSTAFATVAFVVSLAFFLLNAVPVGQAVALAVFVAVTTALLELIAPSALDNLLIPVWAGFLFFLTEGRAGELAASWLLGLIIASAAGAALYRLDWLDAPGAVAAALVGAAGYGLGGWGWLVPLTAFVATTSVLTRLRRPPDQPSKLRGLEAVVSNGVLPLLPVIGHAVDGRAGWYLLHVAAVAVASADTWATETGRLLGRAPLHLRFRTTVEPGTSGAVSLPGTVGSVLGGLLVGLVAAPFAAPGWRLAVVAVGLLVGPLGSLVDSLLGAWVQGRFRCAACSALHERPEHCNAASEHIGGLRGVDNDVVNALANVSGMLAAALLLVAAPVTSF